MDALFVYFGPTLTFTLPTFQVSDHSRAPGAAAGRGSRARTSWRATRGPTRARRTSSAPSATRDSCGPITSGIYWPCANAACRCLPPFGATVSLTQRLTVRHLLPPAANTRRDTPTSTRTVSVNGEPRRPRPPRPATPRRRRRRRPSSSLHPRALQRRRRRRRRYQSAAL